MYIGFTYFRKAKIVTDYFHWSLYACDVVNKIRIEVQNNLPKKETLLYIVHSDEKPEIRISKFNQWIKRNLESDFKARIMLLNPFLDFINCVVSRKM